MEKKNGSSAVLVVDDEPMVLQLAGDILRRFGYAVLIADGGQAAVDLFQERYNAIDAIILDVIMPGMDGKEVFAKLRVLDPQAVIIISSGYPQDRDADEMLQQGAVAFIQKPYRITDLVSVVEQAVGRKKEKPSIAFRQRAE